MASSARDTDFTAKLVDVFPDGEARNLTDGILRLRYRNSLEKPELATPGEIYRVTVDAGVTGNVVPERSSHSPGNFEQQFSALRPQFEYRRRGGAGAQTGEGEPDGLSR